VPRGAACLRPSESGDAPIHRPAVSPPPACRAARLRDVARAAGIDEATLHVALDDVRYLPRVVELDRMQPEIGGDATSQDYATLFDMHMLCWGTGRERTTHEYEQLLERSGWRFVAAQFPPSGAIGVIEAALAAAP